MQTRGSHEDTQGFIYVNNSRAFTESNHGLLQTANSRSVPQPSQIKRSGQGSGGGKKHHRRKRAHIYTTGEI